MEPPTPPPKTTSTTTVWLAVVAALALAVWWVMTRAKKPELYLQDNEAAPPPVPPGVPLSLVEKMASLVNPKIPVVMTSGSAVPYDDADVRQVLREVLDKLNALGEAVSLIHVVNVSKTVDSYKTVTYDIVFNVHDAKAIVGLMLAVTVLVPNTGVRYIRRFELFHKPTTEGPTGTPEVNSRELAAFEDPLTMLSKTKLE